LTGASPVIAPCPAFPVDDRLFISPFYIRLMMKVSSPPRFQDELWQCHQACSPKAGVIEESYVVN
jgi:hypothetical protein